MKGEVGKVNLKMKILSSFTHPHLRFTLVPTCMSFFLLFNTKEDILKIVGNQRVASSHRLIRGINTMEVNGYQQMFFFPHSSKYLLVLNRRNSYRFGRVNHERIFIWVNYCFIWVNDIHSSRNSFSCYIN